MKYRDGPNALNEKPHLYPRSLLEHVVGPAGRRQKNFQRDDVQARIDNIIGNSPEANVIMMMAQIFLGMEQQQRRGGKVDEWGW